MINFDDDTEYVDVELDFFNQSQDDSEYIDVPETFFNDDKPSGDFIPGLKRGIDQTQAMGYGAVALVGSAMGSDSVKNWGMEGYRKNIDEAGENPKKHSFKDVYTGKVGVGGTVDWMQGTFGELVPSMAEAAIGALLGSTVAPGPGTIVGGFTGRTVLKKSIKKLTKELVESQIEKGVIKVGAREIAEAEIEKQVTRQALKKLGGQMGMGAAVLPMESGGNYAGLLEEKGIDAPGTALFFGALATSLEYAGGNSRLIDAFIDGVGSGSGGVIKRAAKELITNIPQEAIQEGGQEVFSILNTIVNTDEKFLTGQNIDQIIESMGVGVVGGFGGFGGATLQTAMPGPSKNESQSLLDPNKGFGGEGLTGLHGDDKSKEKDVLNEGFATTPQEEYSDTIPFAEVPNAEEQGWIDDIERQRNPQAEKQVQAPVNPIQGNYQKNQQQMENMSAPPDYSINDGQDLLAKNIDEFKRVRSQDASVKALENRQQAMGSPINYQRPIEQSANRAFQEFENREETHLPPRDSDIPVVQGASSPFIPAPGVNPVPDVEVENYPFADLVERLGGHEELLGKNAKREHISIDGSKPIDDVPVLEHEVDTKNVNTQPSEAQKKAGNYKKEHIKIDGLNISIENPDGSTRKGKDKSGKKWESTMTGHYGYFKRTLGKDGDQVDVVVKPETESSPTVFIVDQVDPGTGKFDEHKVILGTESEEEAKALYLSNYESGWQGFGDITAMPQSDFKEWLKDGKRTKKPAGEKLQGLKEVVKPGIRGKKSKTYLNDNTEIDFSYEVIEASDLVVSHDDNMNINPEFPTELQPRERSRKASLMQVENIALKLNPERLGSSSSVAQGAPIISDSSNVVESGNGRVLAIRKAYAEKTGLQYKKWINSHAMDFGVTDPELNKIKKPVLARRRITQIKDLAQFTQKANEADTAKLSSTEQAIVDAKNLSSDDLAAFHPSKDGDLAATTNKVFIDRFIGKMTPEEQSGYLTEDGRANKQLIDRVQAAIFQKAYGSSELLKLSAEEADPDIKNILNGLTAGASEFAKAKGLDNKLAELRIIKHLVDGVMYLRQAQKEYPNLKAGKKRTKAQAQVSQALAQQDVFGKKLSNEAEWIAITLAINIRSGKRIGEFVSTIGSLLRESISDLNQMEIFGKKEKASSALLINKALSRIEDKYEDKQQALFGRQDDGGPKGSIHESGINPGTKKSKPNEDSGRATLEDTESREQNTVKEKKRHYNKGVKNVDPKHEKQLTLFSIPDTGISIRAKKAQKGSGNKRKTSGRFEGRLEAKTRVGVRTTGNLLHSGLIVSSDRDAASLLSHLSQSPNESLYTVTVDNRGNVIEVHYYSKGGIQQSTAVPAEIAGRVMSHNNVSHVYILHNHPGGSTDSSVSDRNLGKKLEQLFSLKNLAVSNIVLGRDKNSEPKWGSFDQYGDILIDQNIPRTVKKSSIPIKERVYTKSDSGQNVNPKTISEILKERPSGFVLTDSKLNQTGYLQFKSGMTEKAIGSEIIEAMDITNASGLIPYNKEGHLEKRNNFFKKLAKSLTAAGKNIPVIITEINGRKVESQIDMSNGEISDVDLNDTVYQTTSDFVSGAKQTPGQGVDLKDIQSRFVGQDVFLSPDGHISIRLKNGMGLKIVSTNDMGKGDVQFAIGSGRMGKKGVLLGKYKNSKITLNKDLSSNFARDHELYHFLKDTGIITPADGLKLIGAMKKMQKSGDLTFKLSKNIEENEANTFAQLLKQRESERDTLLDKIVQKVLDFIDRLRYIGRQSFGKVLRETESGKIFSKKKKKDVPQAVSYFDKSEPQGALNNAQSEYSEANTFPKVGMFLTGDISVPRKKVKSVQQVAQMFAGLSDSAQEEVFLVTTEKDGNVLETHKFSKGLADSASALINQLSGHLLKNSEAKTAYLVHNHPSGDLLPSKADQEIMEGLQASLDLNKIKAHGVIIANGQYVEFDSCDTDIPYPIRKILAKKKLPVSERRIVSRVPQRPFIIKDSTTAKERLRDEEDGILLVEGGGREVAFIPYEKGGTIRDAAKKILIEASELNATSAVINVKVLDNTNRWKLYKHLARGLGTQGIGVIDVISETAFGDEISFSESKHLYEIDADGIRALDSDETLYMTSDDIISNEPFSVDDNSGIVDDFKYNIIDMLSPISKVYKAIKSAIPEYADFRLKEQLRVSKAKGRIDRAEETYFAPIKKIIGMAGLTVENVDEFLYARHAPEANARLRLTNARHYLNQLARAQKGAKLKKKIDLLDAKFELEEFPTKENQEEYKNILEEELLKAATEKELKVKEDWEIFSVKPSGMTDAKAREFSEKWEGNKAMIEIAKIFDRMNDESLEISYDAGRLSKQEYESVKGTFEFYAPLFREGHEKKRAFSGIGSGITNLGTDVKTRGGSTKKAVHLLANAIVNHEKTIIKAEKAAVAKAFLEFVKMNPNRDFWDFEETKTRASYDSSGNIIRVPAQILEPNEVKIKVDGKTHIISANPDNVHAMRILDIIQGNQHQSGPIVGALSTLNRFLASINTTLNPEFIISNFTRDLQTAAFNLNDTDVKNMKIKVFKSIPSAMKGLYSIFRGDGKHEWAKIAKKYEAAGAKIGWIDYGRDIETKAKKLESQIDLFRDGYIAKKSINGLFSFIEDYNSIVENAVRLSTFKAGIDAGMSEAKAAIMAKGLTVNFNQKGAYGPVINSLYLFANAGIQGSTRIITALKNSPGARKMVLGSVLAATGLAIANSNLGGDDDEGVPYYDQIDDYLKARNMIIMIPGSKGDFVKIPLPWGYNVFWAFGTEIGDAFTKDNYDPLKGTSRMVSTVMDAFNPLQSASILQTISPTIADPFVQVGENKTFFGSPLMPEGNPFAKFDTPDSQKHWGSVRETSKFIAQQINNLTGGNKIKPGLVDISPETLDLVFDTFTGGMGRFILDTAHLPFDMASDSFEFSKTPVFRKVLGTKSEYKTTTDYRENTSHIYQLIEQMKTYPDEIDKFKQDPTYQLIFHAKKADSTIKKLRKFLKAAKNKGNKQVQEKIEQQIKAVKKAFNKNFRSQQLKN